MRNKSIYVFLSALILAAASCNIQDEILDPETTAETLTEMRSVLTGMEGMLALAVEEEDSDDFGARTISPWAGGHDGYSNADVSAIMGTNDAPKTPDQVYASLSGSGEKRAPETGYMSDLWSEGNDAYFYISPEGSDYYRIKLYTFPRSDFSVKYDYEEYLVEADDTGWGNMDDDLNAGKLTEYKSYLSDGTVADREIMWNSTDGDSNGFADEGYASFSVGNDILGDDFSEYEYPSGISEPSKDSTDDSITWSSWTSSQISRNSTEIEEFYTEEGDSFSGVMYSIKERWSTDTKSVIRYEGDFSTGASLSRRLTTTGNSWDIWATETEIITKGLDSGKITYSQVTDLWWDDPEGAEGRTSSSGTVLTLTETEVDSNNYSGTLSEYWGTRGGTYDVSLTNNENGTYTLSKSGWTSASRSAAGSDMNIVVDQSDDLSFTVSLGNGSFSGNFVQGAITGTYTEGTASAEIIIDSIGITVDGQEYKYSELAE
jgi:hypothetical protein